MVTCYIGIGSNIGDRRFFIDKAIEALKVSKGIKVTDISTIYETKAMSDIPQGDFLNGVIKIETSLEPLELLKELNKTEEGLGRKRTVKNSPRTIDLDILYYGDETIKERDLIVPHPMISEREFVLRGLRELGKV